VTKLKGHATLWWDELQADRRNKVMFKIKNWGRMVAKHKSKFITKNYHLNLLRKLQNLRQKGLSMKEYTKEFYKLNIRVGHRENDEEKVVRYINGLRYAIQDEINMMTMRTVEDDDQVALKAEESCQGSRVNGIEERVLIEKEGLPKKSSRSPEEKMEDIKVRKREEEFL
jgi:hypothetical protein